jgi:hypothetical protein
VTLSSSTRNSRAPGRPHPSALNACRASAAVHDQAERLRAALDELVETAEEAGDDEPRYGVLVSLYQQEATPPS